MLLGACSDTLELADHLVHEHHHNRLFALEAHQALLEEEDPAQPVERFYSPWRDELRSLRGLLHGAYVFVPVHALWHAARALDPAAELHAARISLQLEIAVDLLERYARPTDLGAALLASITERVAAISRATPVPAAVREALGAHVARFDAQGQARATWSRKD